MFNGLSEMLMTRAAAEPSRFLPRWFIWLNGF